MKASGTATRLTADALADWLAPRTDGVAVVSGTFELLQPGNLQSIQAATKLASDVLVIVTPENSTAPGRSGGSARELAERMELVAGLKGVDAVAALDVDTLRAVPGNRNMHWVTGLGAVATDPLAPVLRHAGELVTLPELPGCSTAEVLDAVQADTTPIEVHSVVGDDVYAPQPSTTATVTVNGCFDVLHPGHLRFLRAAAELAERLVIVSNDDASVRRYKGPTRPIFPLAFRRAALLALRPVDEVYAFAEDKPLATLRRLQPAVHAKGGTFEDDRVAEERDLLAEWGGKIAFCELAEGYSTTRYLSTATGSES